MAAFSLQFLAFAVFTLGVYSNPVIEADDNTHATFEPETDQASGLLWFRKMIMSSANSRLTRAAKKKTTKIASPTSPAPEKQKQLATNLPANSTLKNYTVIKSAAGSNLKNKTALANSNITMNKHPKCRLPKNMKKLRSYLSALQFIGLADPAGRDNGRRPSNESLACPDPNDTHSWWPREDVNLRSTCPWVYKELHFGCQYYPSTYNEASCLCERCVASNAMVCEEIKHTIILFKMTKCQNGLTLMTRQRRQVVVGCHCANSAPAISEIIP